MTSQLRTPRSLGTMNAITTGSPRVGISRHLSPGGGEKLR